MVGAGAPRASLSGSSSVFWLSSLGVSLDDEGQYTRERRAQYPLNKGYSLNQNIEGPIIYGIFLI